jgi:hypothetical protein
VIAIIKTGDKLNISNFRPVSLLISFSKLFEKIIYTRIYTYVVSYKILANEKYRFRYRLLADNDSYTLIHEVFSAMSIKHTIGGIFYDLINNFDCVNHRILLAKLEHCGIRGTFGAVIKSCLMEGYQRVALKEEANIVNCSNWELVKYGVTKGSILSPLFFNYK